MRMWLSPATGSLNAGDNISVQVYVDTSGVSVSGITVTLDFSSVVFGVYNGTAGITKWSTSPFDLSSKTISTVNATTSRISMTFAHPSGSAAYNGRVASFAFTGLAPSLAGSAVTFNAAGSQFTPTYGSVIRTGATYTVNGNPVISIIPNAETVAVEGNLGIGIRLSTNGCAASGATFDIRFDPGYFQIVNGTAGVTKSYGSPFNIISTSLTSGRLLVTVAEPSSNRMQYTGDAINFQIHAIQITAPEGSPWTLDPTGTVYAPVMENTTLNNALYVVFNPCPAGPSSAGVIVSQNLLPPGATRIDTLETAQETKADPSGSFGGTNPNYSCVSGAGILGGERDMYSYNQDSTGLIRTSYLQNPRRIQHSTNARGYTIITWDGPDGNAQTVNPTGLGAIDLTESDQKNSFAITINRTDLQPTFEVSVWTDAGNWSKATLTTAGYIGYPPPVGDGLGPKTFLIKFSDFVAQAGWGADFSRVGAISLKIGSSSSSIDLQLGAFETRFAPALTLGIRSCTFISASPQPYRLGLDDGTGIAGITWPLPSVVTSYLIVFNGATYNAGNNTTTFSYTVTGATSQVYTLTLSGNVSVATVDVALRSDITYGQAIIAGPDCVCTAGAATPSPSPSPTASPTPTPATICARIATGNDDVEQNNNSSSGNLGAMYMNSLDLELVTNGTDPGNQIVGLRFTGLTIPKGATITNATIQFTSDAADSAAASLTIKGQASDNAPAFASTTNNLSTANRPRTSASVSWSPAAWTSGAAGSAQLTPNLSSIFQELVNRSGWVSGNSVVILIEGTGVRTAKSYDLASGSAPQLCVSYAVGSGSKKEPLSPPPVLPTASPSPTPRITPNNPPVILRLPGLGPKGQELAGTNRQTPSLDSLVRELAGSR